MKRLVVAFDIERSGATTEYDTLAIGAVCMNEKFEEFDRYYCNCYFPDQTVFEPMCTREFWSQHPDILTSLIYTGDLTKAEREAEMIHGFHAFRQKWEQYAADHSYEYYLVSDNNVYDGTFVNHLMAKHMSHTLPLPYTALTQTYDTFFETHSMTKGLLLAHGVMTDWNITEHLSKLYDMPARRVFHDNNPVNDAHSIAFDMHCLLQIGSGKIVKLEPSKSVE